MSKPALDKIRRVPAPNVTELFAETRIDMAHPAESGLRPADATAASGGERTRSDRGIDLEMLDRDDSPLPPNPAVLSQQAEIQAAQLAERLRQRQQDLDHREAELNARAAQVERDARAARLWYEERQAAMEEAAAEPGSIVLQDEAIRRKAEDLSERENRLEAWDAELSTQREALQKFHEQLLAERQTLDEQSQAGRERLAAEEARMAADNERQRGEIEQRSEQVDQARVALEHLREELARMHRETLEIRLATEELWAELSGSAPSAALTRSLGRIRGRLADHYRLADAEVQQKKQELEQLRDQLSDQYEKLVRQKRSFDIWADECRAEIERQAARLQAHGEEIERREADMGEYARIAQAEKLELQQEIRRLRAKLVSRVQAELPVWVPIAQRKH